MTVTVDPGFVRDAVGKFRVAGDAVVCGTPNGFPLPYGFRATSVGEIA